MWSILLLNIDGGLITSMIPVVTTTAQIILYFRKLSFKKMAANIIVGRILLNIMVIASPKGINVMAIKSVRPLTPPDTANAISTTVMT